MHLEMSINIAFGIVILLQSVLHIPLGLLYLAQKSLEFRNHGIGIPDMRG